MKRASMVAAALLTLVGSQTGFCEEVTGVQGILKNLSKSAVFIRTERILHYEEYSTSGSGFFVHLDGYVLTNWHVVADQIEGRLWQKDREFNAKVLELSVVVDGGTPSEREIPATIVARDRKRDLALFRVKYRPETYIDIDTIDDVEIGHQIWAARFPFGDLLAMERKIRQTDEANPAVTISSGMVTSLRRDAGGKLAMIQTDDDTGLHERRSGFRR